jgi:predicted DNA-binding transcriptional regulator
MFGIAQQTARTDLETLVQKGFLNSKLVGKKILFYL